MKKAPKIYPRVFHDPEVAREYAASTAERSKKLGKEFAKILSRLGFERGRILDVGTGSGEVPIELASVFPQAEVVGLDLSEPLLEIARASASGAGFSDCVSFEKGDALALPFEDSSFDAVVSLNTLRVVDNPVVMLNEIERVLRPNGALVIGDIKRSWLGFFMPILRTAYTAAEAKEILRRSRLRTWEFRQSLLRFSVRASKSVESLLKG